MMRLDTRLPAEPASVEAARRFVSTALATLPDDLVANACLMVSELATNSVIHAGTDFRVAVVRSGRVVRVEVADDAETLPRLRRPRQRDPHGRGLRLVASLSTTWGIEPARRPRSNGAVVAGGPEAAGDAGASGRVGAPRPTGKTLWFSLLVPATGTGPERASA